MTDYIHGCGAKIVGEVMPQERNQVTLAEEKDRFDLPVARVTFSYCDNDRRLIRHALRFQRQLLEAAGATDLFDVEDTAHLMGTCRMGTDPATSVTDADGRCWDIPNLWICDGSLFPTGGAVNPSLTIQALACRAADRIRALAGRGDL
jgi:choline dehydrogenase-like flavoprotein